MSSTKRNRKSKSGRGIKGILEPFCETGTEGIVWSLQDEKHISADGKQWSYDGLNPLEDGDFLKIFNDAAHKKLIWQGEIKLKHPPATRFNRGVQSGVDERKWAQMFFDGKPGTLYKKDVYAQMKAEAAARKQARKEAREKQIADIMRACHEGIEVSPLKRLTLKKPGPKS